MGGWHVTLFASFGEYGSLGTGLLWVALTAVSVLLGITAVVAGVRSKTRGRSAMRLGAAACLTELAGVALVLQDGWGSRYRGASVQAPRFWALVSLPIAL